MRVWNPGRDSVPTLLPHKGCFYGRRRHDPGRGVVHRLPSRDPDSLLVARRTGARLSCIAPPKIICRLEHAPTYDEDEEAGAAVVSWPSRESGWCATGGADGTIKVWDISGSARLRCSLGCGGAVVAMAWRPSSLAVVACSAMGVFTPWDARDGLHATVAGS